jgi:hypothetical protein
MAARERTERFGAAAEVCRSYGRRSVPPHYRNMDLSS